MGWVLDDIWNYYNFVRGDYNMVLRNFLKYLRIKLSCKLETTLKYFSKNDK